MKDMDMVDMNMDMVDLYIVDMEDMDMVDMDMVDMDMVDMVKQGLGPNFGHQRDRVLTLHRYCHFYDFFQKI